MSRALVVLDTEFQRRKAADWCWSLKHGTRVEFKAPKRTDEQNAKMWAMLTEVSTQVKHHGIKLTPDDWKLIFMDALKREVRLIPNLEGNGIISLGRSSSDLSKQEMSDLIELIYEYGARNGVTFRDIHEPSDETARSTDAGTSDVPQSVAGAPLTPDEGAPEDGQNPTDSPSAAPSSNVLSDADRGWLLSVAKQLWPLAAPGYQDDVNRIAKDLKANVPAEIGELARKKALSVVAKVKEVCFGEKVTEDVKVDIAAMIGVEAKEIVA